MFYFGRDRSDDLIRYGGATNTAGTPPLFTSRPPQCHFTPARIAYPAAFDMMFDDDLNIGRDDIIAADEWPILCADGECRDACGLRIEVEAFAARHILK